MVCTLDTYLDRFLNLHISILSVLVAVFDQALIKLVQMCSD